MNAESTANTANTITFASSSNQKYDGILKKSTSKQLRKEFSELMSYVYSVSPPFKIVHVVVTVLRILQLIGPSLFPGYIDFWSSDPVSHKTLKIFSIFFYLIPPDLHDKASFAGIIVYIVVSAIAEMLFFISSKIFKKNANLPHFIPPIISFFMSSLGFILPPIAIELLFSLLSDFVFSDKANKPVTRTIILLIISAIITIIYLYIFIMIALQVLTFQPMSLITVCTMPQIMIITSGLVINAVAAFCEYAGAKTTIIFCFIISVIYFLTFLTVFYKGGLVKEKDSILFMASCFTGFATSAVIAIFLILDKKASFIIIGLFVAFEAVFYIISNFIYKRIVIDRLKILDIIADYPENFETQVKTVNKFINLTVSGFMSLHPICMNFSFSKMGIERWPKEGSVWFVYAKYSAIYPEETQTLAWIFRSVTVNKVKGIEARTVKGQSLSIARQREINLSPDLKSKLNNCNKHITNAKHRLRNVWDMSIQGNISDMEAATKRVIKVIKNCDGDLLHILRLFPNNRFVTRQYARFSKEMLADYVTYADMVEKTRLLQRNVKVNKDQTHEYGLLAYPMLPEKIDVTNQLMVSPTTNADITNSTIDIDDPENENQEREESSFFLNRIEKMRIPSTCGMTTISLILFFVLFAIPVIVILLIIPGFIDGLLKPLDHMYDISLARTLMYQIIGFGLQAFMELKGEFQKPNGTDTNRVPINFGSTYSTHEQLSYLCKQMTLIMERLDQFRSYKSSNINMKKAKEEIFQPTLNYTYYSKTVANPKQISCISALSDIVSQQRELITGNPVSDDFVNTSAILNPSTSMTEIADKFNNALKLMVSFISDNDNQTEKLITYILIAAVVVSVIIFVISAVLGVKWIESNKIEVFHCLTSLPKNEVSQLSENLKILKKETENSTATNKTSNESNKQEDNILKMFMTGGTNANSHDSFYIVAIILIMMVLQVVSVVILLITMKQISKNLRQNSPHLDYLQGMYANLMAATTCITSLIGFGNPNTTISNVDRHSLILRINLRLETTRNYYNLARYGGEDINEPPFAAYQNYIDLVDEEYKCPNPLQITNDFKEATRCYTADDLIILTEGVYRSYTIPYRFGNWPLLPNANEFRIIWDLMIYPTYDIFIYPMSSGIIDTISYDLNELYDSRIIYIIILLVLGFVFEIAFLFLIYYIDSYIRGVLKLLLHCPPQVLAHSSKVMAVLNGNFRKNKGENGTRTIKFYHNVCEELPDSIIVCNQMQEIETTNQAFSRFFGEKTINDVMNKPLNDFLSSSNFKGNIEPLLSVHPQKPVKENLVYKSPDTGSSINLEATSMIINEVIVIVLRDITQTVRYNTLIKEEKQRSDKLLGSILPASLVPRVQAGEKNISFAVQSATIVFMDIVSFTPWCGSLPAEKVMSTLNKLFMKDDNLVAKYQTMTKIKCIGDCYMAAGGIFSEVNQPAVHAKEVVDFGLDALDAISDLNKELNESLRIRVGINSGGPIVAGVLGVGKPTFEILGPAINMAQQMEHHGVPSQVHISRSVYELIYGGSYAIKERGQIEVKNGTVVTYLVNRK